jgi:polar amino acid transport system substrate-binding protein
MTKRFPTRLRAMAALTAGIAVLATCCAAGAASASGTTGPHAGAASASNPYDLVHPGEITVGIYAGGLPYVDDVNGKCVGIDCTDLNEIAAALHLKVNVQVMSFPAMLAGVESHRLDVAMGELSWTAARAKAGLMTDPIYYSRAAVLQTDGTHVDTLAGLQGQTVGVLVGANWIPAVQAIKGTSVSTYQSADQLYSDLTIGRLKYGFIDALQDQYVKKIKPQFHYQSIPLQITAAQVKSNPAYATFLENQEVFYLPKAETSLEAAMNAQIQTMWHDKTIEKALKNFGVANPTPYLTPSAAVLNRRGVDRSKTWVAPSLGYTPAAS